VSSARPAADGPGRGGAVRRQDARSTRSPSPVGTSHGAYKFTRPPTGDILAIERIKQIHRRIPNTHLVMHGSSSVPQEWLAIINEYGGEIPETYGVPVEEIPEGIKHGVRKVNIDTDLRLSSTGAIRRSWPTTRRSSTRASTSRPPRWWP
jgi:fructose/tagatose bisphosphate aldolase